MIKSSPRKRSPKNDVIILKKSKNSTKKFAVIVGNKTINFGASGYSDYTIHKDPERKLRYEMRHRPRENWTKYGIRTAGFWSKWLLWNKPSLQQSILDVQKKFRIAIINQSTNL